MGEESRDVWQNTGYIGTKSHEFELFERDNKLESDEKMISFDTILPDDIWEKIFSFLPVASIIRAGFVCKRWYEAVHSGKYSWFNMPLQKPWYCMLVFFNNIAGYSYDPSFRKWYKFDFLSLDKYIGLISSSCGLVCFMDYKNENKIFVCNPILRDKRQLPIPPKGTHSDSNALALSVDKFSHSYRVALVKSKQFPNDLNSEFTIQIFESKSCLWTTLIDEVLVGWRWCNESVICDDTLYCLIYPISGNYEPRHGLIMYNIHSKSFCNSSIQTMIMAPCPLTWCRLMNLRDKLVMVGGIGGLNWTHIIKEIGIWTLQDKKWQKVARIPSKLFQRMGEFNDVFDCSGAEDLIFIHRYDDPVITIFDMTKKQWKWTTYSPITKRFSYQLYTAFCFKPNLEFKP